MIPAGAAPVPRRKARVPIATKIFGIALALLLLLAAVAVLSTRNISRVRAELLAVADVFTPLSHLASSVQIHQVEQELHMERALAGIGRVQAGSSTSQRAAAAAAAVQSEGRLVDERIKQAEQLIDEGALRVTREADRTELAVLRERLRAVEHEHHGFERRAMAILDAVQSGQREGADMLLGQLEQDEDEFVAELDRLRKDVQAYSQGSSAEAAEHQQQVLRLNMLITGAAVISGLLFAGIITMGLVRPIARLVQGTTEVEQGQLEVNVPVTSRDEIGTLTASFNAMVEQLRVKERIKQTFGQYIDPRVVEQLLQQSATVGAAGERRNVTVAFTDIRGFTSLGEHLTPAALVQVINRYFSLMAEPVVQEGGIVDKFIGDAVMAFWSPPFVGPGEHARRACSAAIRQVHQLQQLRKEMPDLVGLRRGTPDIGVRIGIATGDAIVGSIGSDRVKGFTVMGDTVNVASRLEGAGKVYGTTILISEEAREQAGPAIETREIDSIRVAGRQEPLRIYELLSIETPLDDETARLRDTFERGLASYRARDVATARAHFESCLRIRPEDGPSRVFLERLSRVGADALPADWDGVWTLTSK